MKIAPIASALLCFACLALPCAQAKTADEYSGKVLYRYTDDKGIQVLDDLVPPRFVAKGYEVLTPTGRLLKVVPPQLTGKELREQQRREAQMEADRRLLKRYNSVADIESARSRKLAIVEQDMAIMRSNVSSLGRQIEQEEAAAARTQRNGREVAPELLQRIADLREEVKVLRERLSRREAEAVSINREFDQAAARYAEIAEN
ncbi:hypothetical protein SAMN04487965_1840 [Microbulbifer donghaiensis]|uniref:DUF4124 domain-containing protein n=1 Tax=Microbulbifer donghaiensis TaxID=494016 RepID=A0A1M5AF12_9GAMM|nr:hypothetical protein [Microbulbifer donghaiensis]SHF28744.1 hypothetical protein SAMN04487965_1840 [Microbulbifer donghaiensis]